MTPPRNDDADDDARTRFYTPSELKASVHTVGERSVGAKSPMLKAVGLLVGIALFVVAIQQLGRSDQTTENVSVLQTGSMMIDETWCEGLVDHLVPKYVDELWQQELKKSPTRRMHRPFLAQGIHDHVLNEVMHCKDDAFNKVNSSYWHCIWRSGVDGEKTCPKDK